MAKKKAAVPKVTRISAIQKVERVEDLKPKTKSKSKKALAKPKVKSVKSIAKEMTTETIVSEPVVKKGEAKLTISFNKKKIAILAVVLVVALGGWLAFREYKQTKDVANNPELAKQEEIKKTIKDVSSHVQFDGVENAVVSTVNDKELDNLKKQDFFKDVQPGDKILVYADSKRVILFRPSLNKIINMTQLSVTTGTDATKQ